MMDAASQEGAMNAREDVGARLSAVFAAMGIDSGDYVESTLEQALEHRDRAKEGTKSRLNAAIRNSGIKVQGFRDLSRAPIQAMKGPVLVEVVSGNDKLAGAALMSWMESNGRLRKAVTGHLKGRGISTGGIDARKGEFDSIWTRSEWEGERSALMESNDGFDEDDVGLMLCCVSGMMPEPPDMERHRIRSELFNGWVRDLERLDPDADDWLDLDLFGTVLSQIGDDKASERGNAQSGAIKSGIGAVAEEYSDELEYLGVELEAWADVGTQHSMDTIANAREFVSKLEERLSAYRPIRPQASTRGEELERRDAREESEGTIIEGAKLWGEFVVKLREVAKDEAAAIEDTAPLEEYEAVKLDLEARTAELEAVKADAERMRAEVEQLGVEVAKSAAADGVTAREYEALKRDVERLAADNEQLRESNEGLESDMVALDAVISQLRDRLSESRRMEAVWRGSYEAERAKQAQGPEVEPSDLDSVTDALDLAEERFPNQLLIALNSKSDKNSPFQKPDEVFGALEWLATEYHGLRINPGSSPDFNMLVKQACPGWSYKPGQTEVTKEQFNQWVHDLARRQDLHAGEAPCQRHEPQPAEHHTDSVRLG